MALDAGGGTGAGREGRFRGDRGVFFFSLFSSFISSKLSLL